MGAVFLCDTFPWLHLIGMNLFVGRKPNQTNSVSFPTPSFSISSTTLSPEIREENDLGPVPMVAFSLSSRKGPKKLSQ
jgi:hypothetical protein